MRKKNEKVVFVSPTAYRNIFTDINFSSFYLPIIETALYEGLISDDSRVFRPTANATRAEAYMMIMSAVCLSTTSTDVSWQERIHDVAFKNGLTNKSWFGFRANAPIQARELHVLTARAADWAETTGGCNPKPLECN